MTELKKALKVSDLVPGSGKTVEVEGKQIAVFNVEGQFHAIDNTCLHRGGPLGEGSLCNQEVTCPWHGWEFNVTTGEAAHDPSQKIKVYDVKVEGEDVLIGV